MAERMSVHEDAGATVPAGSLAPNRPSDLLRSRSVVRSSAMSHAFLSCFFQRRLRSRTVLALSGPPTVVPQFRFAFLSRAELL